MLDEGVGWLDELTIRDKRFVKVATAKELLAEEQLKACLRIQRTWASEGRQASLLTVASEHDWLTSAELPWIRHLISELGEREDKASGKFSRTAIARAAAADATDARPSERMRRPSSRANCRSASGLPTIPAPRRPATRKITRSVLPERANRERPAGPGDSRRGTSDSHRLGRSGSSPAYRGGGQAPGSYRFSRGFVIGSAILLSFMVQGVGLALARLTSEHSQAERVLPVASHPPDSPDVARHDRALAPGRPEPTPTR